MALHFSSAQDCNGSFVSTREKTDAPPCWASCRVPGILGASFKFQTPDRSGVLAAAVCASAVISAPAAKIAIKANVVTNKPFRILEPSLCLAVGTGATVAAVYDRRLGFDIPGGHR